MRISPDPLDVFFGVFIGILCKQLPFLLGHLWAHLHTRLAELSIGIEEKKIPWEGEFSLRSDP